jgi:hypothetical protein
MSTERGWIVEPPPPQKDWRDSHYSRMADRIAARDREAAAEVKRALLAKLDASNTPERRLRTTRE